MYCVSLSRYSRLLSVLVVRSAVVVVRNWGSRTGHSRVVGYAPAIAVIVIMVLLFGNQGPSAAEGTKLSIFMSMGLVLVILFLPESLLARAGGIVVRGAGTVTLFPLACAAEDDFQSCGD